MFILTNIYRNYCKIASAADELSLNIKKSLAVGNTTKLLMHDRWRASDSTELALKSIAPAYTTSSIIYICKTDKDTLKHIRCVKPLGCRDNTTWNFAESVSVGPALPRRQDILKTNSSRSHAHYRPRLPLCFNWRLVTKQLSSFQADTLDCHAGAWAYLYSSTFPAMPITRSDS